VPDDEDGELAEEPFGSENLSPEEVQWIFEHDEEGPGPAERARALTSSLPPGTGLAGLLEDQARDRLDDAALVESMAAWRRVASWAQAGELAAVAELSRRRPSRRWDHRDDAAGAAGLPEPVAVSRETVEEVSLALTLTRWSADAEAHLAVRLARRLPATLAAMSAGRIDLPRARLIDDAVGVLDDEAAGRVEDKILPDAGTMTTGELREALRRAVISVDPAAAERRRETAERQARVGLYGAPDGTASLCGQSLPAVHAAAAMARVAAIARAMKAAGMRGGIDLLRAHAFVGLLLGTLPLIGPPSDDGPGGPPSPRDPGGPGPDDHDDPDRHDDHDIRPGQDDHDGGPPSGTGPGRRTGTAHPGPASRGSTGHHDSTEPDTPATPATPATDTPADSTHPSHPPGDTEPARRTGTAHPDPANRDSTRHHNGTEPDTPDTETPPDSTHPSHPPSGTRPGRRTGTAGRDSHDANPAGHWEGSKPASPEEASSMGGPDPADRGADPDHGGPAKPDSEPGDRALADPADIEHPGRGDPAKPGQSDIPNGEGMPGEDSRRDEGTDSRNDRGRPGARQRDADRAAAPEWPALPVPGDAPAPGCALVGLTGSADRSVRSGKLSLAVPWRTLAGLSGEPGRISWIGPITPLSARDLAVAASADPCCDWNVIVTDEDGRAIAVSRVPRRRTRAVGATGAAGQGGGGQGGGGPGLISEVTVTLPRGLLPGSSTPLPAEVPAADTAHTAAAVSPAGIASAPAGIASVVAGIASVVAGAAVAHRLGEILADTMAAAARAVARADTQVAADTSEHGCAHAVASPGYRVPPRMREYVQARDRTCRSPVCRQPASRCDQDHTVPHHQGGPTCPCNIGPECRTHHQLKQLSGWRLEQPSPGVFTWTTPAGLTYTVRPDPHPV